MQEHYLVIVMKREESKVFSGVWMCLGEKLDIIEQEKAINIKMGWIVTKKLHPYP